MVVWGDSIYVFGGDDSQGFCGDLHSFDTVNKTWSTVLPSVLPSPDPDPDPAAAVLATTGVGQDQWAEEAGAPVVLPRPRRSHTAVEHLDSM